MFVSLTARLAAVDPPTEERADGAGIALGFEYLRIPRLVRPLAAHRTINGWMRSRGAEGGEIFTGIAVSGQGR